MHTVAENIVAQSCGAYEAPLRSEHDLSYNWQTEYHMASQPSHYVAERQPDTYNYNYPYCYPPIATPAYQYPEQNTTMQTPYPGFECSSQYQYTTPSYSHADISDPYQYGQANQYNYVSNAFPREMLTDVSGTAESGVDWA